MVSDAPLPGGVEGVGGLQVLFGEGDSVSALVWEMVKWPRGAGALANWSEVHTSFVLGCGPGFWSGRRGVVRLEGSPNPPKSERAGCGGRGPGGPCTPALADSCPPACRPSSLGEDFYREAIEHCRSYNARLCAERSLRLPFLDSQTGVAQNNCYIWMEKTHRGPGTVWPQDRFTRIPPAVGGRNGDSTSWRTPGSGPASTRLVGAAARTPIGVPEPAVRPSTYCEAPLKKEGGLPEGPVLEALLCAETGEKKIELKEEETIMDCQKQQLLEFPHDLEVEDLEDDIPRRKNRAKGKAYGIGGLRKRQDTASLEDRDKPYVCDICGKRYKNRPGLSYHYTHTHLAEEEGEENAERHALPFHRKNNHKQGPGWGWG
ncbi:Zinc finger protein neuro-d4 [Saguinus oedipus]|uniref:Zinc finger protein neuro-d4 n=1 Tax=Saguinus oedipus TaxID=9490 RepID=A0ABQ9TU72_SAGOE|nr:Zinc finger protein neuro-d4 [Saguinus oedipus]